MIDDERLDGPVILISISRQRLELKDHSEIFRSFVVSTANNGPGERMGSECTPRGWHRVRAKIGAGMPLMTVFAGRRPTGEIYSRELAAKFPARDWILTRILWLSGLEAHHNRYGNVDTAWRYIYIHGSPDEEIAGQPNSHGCIRMKNSDVVELFDFVDCKTRVLIRE